MSSLVSRFKEAGLPLALSGRPVVGSVVGSGADQIVQMSIGKGTREDGFRERFWISRGNAANRVEVIGIDRKLRQLVLFVHEPAREFEERVWKSEAIGRGAWVIEKSKAEARKRHYLMGMDERHLFIAELPRPATTVAAAHAALRPNEAGSTTAHSGKVVRQGEWFFLLPSPAESVLLEEGIRTNRVVAWRKTAIGPVFDGSPSEHALTAMSGNARVRQRQGNPHVADEVVILSGTIPAEGRRVFVRGAIRHPEHKTVTVDGWRKVLRNAEPISNDQRQRRVAWVD